MILALILLPLMLAFGCGDDAPRPDDADSAMPDADAPATIAPVVIAPPAPPVLTPCPEGFTATTTCGIATCDPRPYPAGTTVATACAAGEAAFPGDAACAPVGPCIDGFPADATDADVFVDASSRGAHDGSRARPFDSIADALSAATAGKRIVIAPGEYGERIVITRDVELAFACAERAHVAIPDGLLVDVTAGRATISGATLESASVVRVRDGASLTLRSVHLIQGEGAAIELLDGSHLEGDRMLVTRRPTSFVRHGVFLHDGATANLVRLDIARSELAGVYAEGARASVTLDRAYIHEIDDDGDHAALHVTDGAHATVRRSLFEHNERIAILAADRGDVVLEDTVIRDTRSSGDTGTLGHGVEVDHASAWLRRVLAERNSNAGMHTAGGELSIVDSVVCDTQLAETFVGLGGAGLVMHALAIVEIERLHIGESRALAIVSTGSTLEASDLHITDTRVGLPGGYARGVAFEGSSWAHITRMRLERSVELSLVAFSSELTLEDVEVLDTLHTPCEGGVRCQTEPGGFGLGVYDDARVSLTRFAIRDAPICGIQIAAKPDLGPPVLDFGSGEVSGCGIGACIQADVDAEALQASVRFIDNRAPVDATQLPVPEPAFSLGN